MIIRDIIFWTYKVIEYKMTVLLFFSWPFKSIEVSSQYFKNDLGVKQKS